MFNILIIVALSCAVATQNGMRTRDGSTGVGHFDESTCAACAVGATLDIDWRPVCRDVSFYTVSIFMLGGFFWDGKIQWSAEQGAAPDSPSPRALV
jgi:hypothetical protein